MDSIQKYRERFPIQDAFTKKLADLIGDFLKLANIDYHTIECRTKSIESFEGKIKRKNNKYVDPLNEITDLSGIRIIVYYQDHIDEIVNFLKGEFTIDEKNSSYTNSQSPNEFGYSSIHLVLQLNETRFNLMEWKSSRKLKAEIQIRSVLQHAWASISHTLQYKSKNDIPNKLQRQLFRLAGLFELADEEFLDIRDKHNELSNEIASIDHIELSDTQIDLLSIQTYVSNSTVVDDIFETAMLSGFSNLKGADIQIDSSTNHSQLVSFCFKLGIRTIKDLNKILLTFSKEVQEEIFEGLINHKSRQKSNVWFTDRDFIIMLLLTKYKIEMLSTEDLTDMGWNKGIADQVLEVLRNSN